MQRKSVIVALVLASAAAAVAVLATDSDGERTRGVEPTPVSPQAEVIESELADEAPEIAVAPGDAPGAEPDRAEALDEETDEGPPRPCLRVTVLDALERRPIEGAEVMLLDRATPGRRRTDEHGVCVLPLRDEASEERLRVEAAGYCVSSRAGPHGNSEVVELTPATTLFGRVVDAASGAAVAEARIELVRDPFADVQPVETTSAPDGAYELVRVPLDTGSALEVRAHGFALQRIPFELPRGKARTRQDLRLVRGEEIAGRVEDWTTGRGVAGARVSGVVADENGEFRGPVFTFPGTRWGRIEVEAPEYVALRGWSYLAETAEHVYRLPRPAVIAGEVRALAGPITGASVSFTAQGPVRVDGAIEETSPLYELPQGWSYELVDSGSVATDAQGRYHLSVLPWSLNGTVGAVAPGLAGRSILRAVGEPGFEHRVDLWLDGQPPEEATCVSGSVRVNGDGGGFAGSVIWRVAEQSGSVVLERGSFRAAVPPGEVRLVAILSLLPDAPSEEVVVRVDEGRQRGVTLDVLAPLATISGRVRTYAGQPVSGARVEAGPVSARTDERGAYALHVTDYGSAYDLRATLGDEESYKLRGILPGSRDVDFLVADGHRFFVRVVDGGTGAVLQVGYPVQLLSRTGAGNFWDLRPSSMARDAEGWFEFRSPQRELELLALPLTGPLALHGTALARARLDGEETQRVELVLRRVVPVVLELARDAEPWPEDQELAAVEEGLRHAAVNGAAWHELQERRRVRFDEHGVARVELAPGAFSFAGVPPGWSVAPQVFHVEPGMLPLVVDWTRGE